MGFWNIVPSSRVSKSQAYIEGLVGKCEKYTGIVIMCLLGVILKKGMFMHSQRRLSV